MTQPIPEPDLRAMPNGTERPGEHWNARLIREAAERKAAAEPAPLTLRAILLRDAVLTAVIAYGGATQEYGMATTGGASGDKRHQLLEQTEVTFAEVLRLTRELPADDTNGGAS